MGPAVFVEELETYVTRLLNQEEAAHAEAS